MIRKLADQFETGTVIYENERFYVKVDGEGRYPYQDENGHELESDTLTDEVWKLAKKTYPEVKDMEEYVTQCSLNNKWFDMYDNDGNHIDNVFFDVELDEQGNLSESEIASCEDAYKEYLKRIED